MTRSLANLMYRGSVGRIRICAVRQCHVRQAFRLLWLGALIISGWTAPLPAAEPTDSRARARERLESIEVPPLSLAPFEAPEGEKAPATRPAEGEPIRLVPYTNYEGNLLERPGLTGDWGGVRQKLMDKGLRFDMSLTQWMQGVVAGGVRNQFRYRSRLDLVGSLDTGAAGLWPGGLLQVGTQAGYGRAANRDTGALMPVNWGAQFPVPGEDAMELVEFSYTQFLAPWIGVTGGKYYAATANIFAHDETTQFMNTAFNVNPICTTTVPLSFLGAGVILLPAKDLTLTTLVLDSDGTADRCGFDTVFDSGTTVFQQLGVGIRPFGLSGNQRFGWTWSDKLRAQLNQSPDVVIESLQTGDVSGLITSNDDWSVFYDFDQYLYQVPGAEDRGIGIFGRFGVSRATVNPVKTFYSIGFSGKGMIPGRKRDTFGVGYYYIGLASDLPPPVLAATNDEQGVEIYYNIKITPWLQITPDLQALRPARGDTDCTWVAGLRAKVNF